MGTATYVQVYSFIDHPRYTCYGCGGHAETVGSLITFRAPGVDGERTDFRCMTCLGAMLSSGVLPVGGDTEAATCTVDDCSNPVVEHRCEFHTECDACSATATSRLCDDHVPSDDDEPECDECSQTATSRYCDDHQPSSSDCAGCGCSIDSDESRYCQRCAYCADCEDTIAHKCEDCAAPSTCARCGGSVHSADGGVSLCYEHDHVVTCDVPGCFGDADGIRKCIAHTPKLAASIEITPTTNVEDDGSTVQIDGATFRFG